MWKKSLVILITVISTMSIAFAYNYVQKNMKASSTTYTSGGNATGRIGPAGRLPNGNAGAMEKGDFIAFKEQSAGGADLNWRLIANSLSNASNPGRVIPNSTNMYGYTLDSSAAVSMNANQWHVISGLMEISSYVHPGTNYIRRTSLMKEKIAYLNNAVKTNTIENDLLMERLVFNTLVADPNPDLKDQGYVDYLDSGKIFEFNSFYEFGARIASQFGAAGMNLPASDFMLSTTECPNGSYWSGINHGGDITGQSAHCIVCNSGELGGAVKFTSEITYRVAAFLDLEEVVFALSDYKGTAQTNAVFNVTKPTYGGTMAKVTGEAMKLRILDNSRMIDLKDVVNSNNESYYTKQGISKNDAIKIIENSSIYLKVNANAGGNNGGTNTVSALVFDNSNNFIKYVPLGTAGGEQQYMVDVGGLGLTVGNTYYIRLVNENYTGSDRAPVYCSAMSEKMSVQIVQGHRITYTKQPASGAGGGKDYEYSKNVNAGQTVGKITVNPQGVMPLTYSLEADGDNTYQNFELDGLDTNHASSSTSLNVKVKSNAPDLVNGGLKAGTYKFCINAVDANGNPTPATSDTRVCTALTVEKTDTSVSFTNPNTTNKSVSGAAIAWNETASATPSTGIKITYSISGGDVSLISIDADTGLITYKGSGAYGKVKIKATADDDPSSGNDNYNSSFAEKEIVIYREVDGTVTPHANSSSTQTPTFTAADSNVKVNGIIGTISGMNGTPDTIGGSTTTYQYGLKAGVGDANFFSVDTNSGVIKTTANLGVQSYSITVTVSDKWSTKEIPVTINVGMSAAENLKFYENSTSSTAITTKSVKVTDSNVVVFATVKGSTNNSPVTYKIKDGSTNVIEVHQNSGAVTIHSVGTVTIVAEKQGINGQAKATAELTFTVTAGAQNFIYTDNAGNELPKQTDKYKAYEEIYAKDKTFQLYTAGNPTGSTVTYQLKTGSPSDVISVDNNGLVHILNASLNTQMGKVIVEAISHDPSGNYSDKTIELPINIKKADQTISFADVTYATSGKGKVTPVINEQDLSSNDGGVQVNDTDYYITIDSSINTSVAWTNNGVDIEYNYSGNDGIDIPLHVEKAGNRNYNKATAEGSMRIMGPDESTLAVNRPGKIVYGERFEIKSLQDDSSSTNVQYTFEVDKTTYISAPTVSGNKAEFDALKFSGTTSINIKITRTADGETPLSKTISVQVLPKEIEIVIDDKEKYKGEQNPNLTYQDFRTELVSWNGTQDTIQENDIKLNTTAKTGSNAGSYSIKGDAEILNRTYPNYSFKYKEGTLTIKEDNIEDDWYHLELDDGNNTAYTGIWTNQDVNIISDHYEYVNLSLDQSTWKPTQVTIAREGETNQDFWMKKDSGAVTKVKQETIRIDKTAPKVKNIKAKDSNNKLQDIINKLSGGIFFKPGTSFEITTDDSNDDLKVSGTKEISYKIYKLDSQERATEELIKEGNLTVTSEKASITISETTGRYKVCVTAIDNASNTSTESCHEAELKKIDVDVDGDGKPDFNDPDGDGCPDLNIKWKDPSDETKWIVINGDRNNDKIPDLNIDSDGDGIPDLNIDTDNDGKPDLNLVILKKTDWKPTKCVQADIDNGILEEYCTGTNVKAVINVDTDNDGIPNINIDNQGDFKPHLNISKDGVNASVNITDVHEWKPEKNYTGGKFTFDSVGNEYKPQINVDSDGDGRPDINIDLDGDGVPDINIDTDGDNIPNINIDSDGDGIPDVNVDTDDDGNPDENIKDITEWKPNKDVDGDVPYDTMDFSEKEEPDEPSEPTKPNKSTTDTDVKGSYYPGDNVGGAITGDETNLMLYIVLFLSAITVMNYLIYRKQKGNSHN